LLCLGSENESGANLPKCSEYALVFEIIKIHVGSQGSLPYGPFFSHPGSCLLLLDKVLIAVKDALGFLTVILGRIPYTHFRLVQRARGY
jgi:hypothetical protein